MLDVECFGQDPRAHAAVLFAAGADWIQLRDRDAPDDVLCETARALVYARDAANEARNDSVAQRARVIVNRRVDIAQASRADGVHLGFDAISEVDARRILGDDALVGRSLHSVDEITEAAGGQSVDYVHLAPIWDPNSKPATRPAVGLAQLAEACRTGMPVIAQGGVDPDRAKEAVTAGVLGVAVTGALRSGANDPAALLSPLRRALGNVQGNTSTS